MEVSVGAAEVNSRARAINHQEPCLLPESCVVKILWLCSCFILETVARCRHAWWDPPVPDEVIVVNSDLTAFFPSLQSMRSTDCVKVQTIWIYTSKWSGCTMNMFVICPPSREKCLNIQRECVMSPVVNPHYLPPCVTLRAVIRFSCGCLNDSAAFRFSVFTCMFVPFNVLCHCPWHNSIPYCTVSPEISKALSMTRTVLKPLCACNVSFGQFLNSRLLDICSH